MSKTLKDFEEEFYSYEDKVNHSKEKLDSLLVEYASGKPISLKDVDREFKTLKSLLKECRKICNEYSKMVDTTKK